MNVQLGDLVTSRSDERDLGIIIGMTRSCQGSWADNPHAQAVTQGLPLVYYVYYSSGRFDGPVFGDTLVPAR